MLCMCRNMLCLTISEDVCIWLRLHGLNTQSQWYHRGKQSSLSTGPVSFSSEREKMDVLGGGEREGLLLSRGAHERAHTDARLAQKVVVPQVIRPLLVLIVHLYKTF